MAYLCNTSTFAGRFFKEGQVYDTIGAAAAKFFTETAADGADQPVVETGLPDDRKAVRDALDELGVEYNTRLGVDKLKEILGEAQAAAILT